MGCHALLQEIFLAQGLNPRVLCPLHWQVGSFLLAPLGSPTPQAKRSQIPGRNGMDKGRPSLPSALVLIGRAPGQDMDAGHSPASKRDLFQHWGPPSPRGTLGSSQGSSQTLPPCQGAQVGLSLRIPSLLPALASRGRCSLPLSKQGLVGPPSASHSGPLCS